MFGRFVILDTQRSETRWLKSNEVYRKTFDRADISAVCCSSTIRGGRGKRDLYFSEFTSRSSPPANSCDSLRPLRLFLDRLENCRLRNQYGPTESHVVTEYTLDPPFRHESDLPPIGRPIANTQIYLLDPHLNPVPIGVAGELHIGGDGVAQGYFNRAELTQEKFIANPFSTDPGARLYKTGDLARYLPDGNIEFLGRIDNQVKDPRLSHRAR